MSGYWQQSHRFQAARSRRFAPPLLRAPAYAKCHKGAPFLAVSSKIFPNLCAILAAHFISAKFNCFEILRREILRI